MSRVGYIKLPGSVFRVECVGGCLYHIVERTLGDYVPKSEFVIVLPHRLFDTAELAGEAQYYSWEL